ncbi:MAG: ATP-dependent DNA helicase RecG [Gemmataceae bacterium]|nr:ATP-dependent DNA helicase RecG [Gemmataceae bacterium]
MSNPPPSTPDPLEQNVQFLKGVGPGRAELLARLGIQTARDLLFHFPRAYEDLTDVRPIASLEEGTLQTVRGEVVEIDGRRLADGRPVVSIVLSDGGKVCLEGTWFGQAHAARRFRYGQRVAFSGKPKWFRDHWQMNNPRVQYLDETTYPDLSSLPTGAAASTGGSQIVPVYPLTEDLRAEHLRPILRRAVDTFAEQVAEILPEELRRKRSLPEMSQALEDVHFPKDLAAARAARRRFVYEEFLILQVALAIRRRDLRDRQRAPKLPVTSRIDEHIRRLFPFPLTEDQDRAVADLCDDLASDRPMQRLLQADVGAGKTAVAVYALLVTVANKHQAALMAPTEVLARQHWDTLESYLAQSRVRRLLLTGGLTARERREALAALKAGEVDLVVGTQALVSEDVQFARLGLVVIDEQHKFGVNQRARMRRLGVDPHYLVMTATPIPRTVALTVFGDLDCSTIRQLPPGRQPLLTRWLTEKQRQRLYPYLLEQLRQKRQAYLVCPLVEESEALDVKAAEQTFAELKSGPLGQLRLGLLHGRMDEDAKDEVMGRFRAGEIDLLVSTLVIEVGVDVPNATLMIVEHAERFGLSQLHQLRGRVSRGKVRGECYLFTGPVVNDETRERLRIFTRVSDGFQLAEEDARLRGAGEFFGTRQHGGGELRFGDLIADRGLLEEARRDAFQLVAADAGLKRPEHELLRKAVLERYGRTLDLAEIG